MTKLNLGLIAPKDDKLPYVLKYRFSKKILSWGLDTTTPVNKAFYYPLDLVDWYNQKTLNGCVGYSCSWLSTMLNIMETGNVYKYDATWLYHTAQLTDRDKNTDPARNNGAYLWAGLDVLRKVGHRKIMNSVVLEPNIYEGITSYYWIKTIAELRAAYLIDRPVVFGLPWYDSFFNPKKIDGEWWIGENLFWGKSKGGHAIISVEISDNLNAIRLLSTWGMDYPPVWISYKNLKKLLNKGGEAAVAIDRKLEAIFSAQTEENY